MNKYPEGANFPFFSFPFYSSLIRSTADSAIYKSVPPKGIWFIFEKWMCVFYYAWQVWLESKYENCILHYRPLGNELHGNTNLSTIEKHHNMKALSRKLSKRTVGEEQIRVFFSLYLYYLVIFASFFLSRKEMPVLEQQLNSGLSHLHSILKLCSFACPALTTPGYITETTIWKGKKSRLGTHPGIESGWKKGI